MQVIDGDDRTFDALIHPTNGLSVDYVAQRVQENIGKVAEPFKQFVERAITVASKIDDSLSAIRARLSLSNADKALGEFTIQVLPYDRLHTANRMTQRVIMAEPTIRRLYQKNRCDGFYGSYQDYEPDAIGDDHTDYQYLKDGIIDHHDPDGDEDDCWVCSFYSNYTIDELEAITPIDQINAMEIWEHVKIAIARDIDPTNPDGSTL